MGNRTNVEAVGRLARQREVPGKALLTAFCGSRGLIAGVPGLARSLMIRSLGRDDCGGRQGSQD